MEMTELVQAHMSPPAGMVFHLSIESVRHDASLLGYWSVIERAWFQLKLDGVLCLDSRPVLYLKEHSHPLSIKERILFQRLFWNQGVANILVLADPTTVYIYSGLARPLSDEPDEEALEYALVETLAQVEYAQSVHSLCHALASGHYYEAHRQHFDPHQSVDSWLLDNLRDLRNALIQGNERLDDIKDAHAFIGRVLFLCYLLDRGIVSLGKPDRTRTGTMVLAKRLEEQSPSTRIDNLYDLFDDLKIRFNGNMFDQDLDAERNIIRTSHIEKLILFLGGHNVGSGQRSLGFWPYDFKMIPVETISAIYQDFLAAEDREGQRKRGAFYTPRFLAEMVVDTAVREEPDAFEWSFLDAACGSGIFLVIVFNRLANHWLHTQEKLVDYAAKAKALQDILAHQIRGVDVEETACRIACFSLYLAYLDFFEPPDIKEYMERTGRPLPKLLDYGDESSRPEVDIPVIHKADFLVDDRLSGQKYDCIIGNPPWAGRQRKLLAQKFMQRAPHFLRDDGIGCLLLPSKILQNQTDAFQAEWLQHVTLERVLQLADFRFLLFQNALCPAFIARFKKARPLPNRHKVEFAAPKFNRDGLRQGIITINPSARTWIPLNDILAATRAKTAPVVWKRRLWGTARDQRLLDLLQSLPPLSNLAGTPKEGKRWIKGQGMQPYYTVKAETLRDYPKPRPNPWSLDMPFVRADPHLQMIVSPQVCTTLGERLEKLGASTENLRRVPNERLFKAPMVLISQGFGKVAYCSFDVLFQDSLQSISGPPGDADLLMFLAAYLRSNLAKYFLFHTSANWGSERDKVHLFELLRVPFPLPGNELASPDAGPIVDLVANRMTQIPDELKEKLSLLVADDRSHSLFLSYDDHAHGRRQWRKDRKRSIDSLQKEFEPLIYRYFGLTEQEISLVEDAIHIFIPSSTPTTWRTPKTVTLDPVQDTAVEPYSCHGLRVYADTLSGTLNKWAHAEGSEYRVRTEGGTDDKTGLAMVTLSLSRAEGAFRQKALSMDLTQTLKEFYAEASERSGPLSYERDIFVFQGEQIYIVRPNILLNWTRTAALNDAARIYGEIALAQKES